MKNGSCSATTVAGSAALPFVISTGEVMGLRPAQGDEKRVLFTQRLLQEAPPSPLSSRPEKSWAFGPPKVMKNGSCSRNDCCRKRRPPLCHLDRRSHGPSAHPRDEKRVLFIKHCCWNRRPPLCLLAGRSK